MSKNEAKKGAKKMFGTVFLEGWRKGFFGKMFKNWPKTGQKVSKKEDPKPKNGALLSKKGPGPKTMPGHMAL